MTDWSGHIDVVIGAGILIFIQMLVNLYFWSKIHIGLQEFLTLRRWYGKTKY